ncbi:MAG: hypothetical protein GX111_07295, partial [Clostridiales bacterium]|nr:hypothetical protein [Clostridiales bacterium]
FLPDYIPEEGYSTLPYPAELRNRTGVTIEYVVVAMQSLPEQFPILLAADDLPNVIINADWYYQGSLTSGVDDGYFANLYEYREYMPNYWYIAHSHPEDPSFLAHLLPEDDMIVSMWCYEQERAFLYGTVTRGDWLEKLGMVNDDLVTFDDIHILLKTFKTEFDCDWPFMLTKTLGNYGFFNAMDTIPVITNTLGALVDNGQVAFTHTRAQDFNFMTLINQWYSEGLIEPDWMSIAASVDAKDLITAGKMAVVGLVPTEVPGYEPPNAVVADPNMYFVPIHMPLVYEGQTIHCGDARKWVSYGSWTINAKTENMPLLVSYLDYFYSEEGAFFSNWGIEGDTFVYNESGEPQLSDFIMEHPGGMAMAICAFMRNPLTEGGVSYIWRTYAYPGGDRFKGFLDYWADYDYDGTMQWPSSITFTPEQTGRLTQYSVDLMTYITENYLLFVDGSEPLSEWNSYVDGLVASGLNECQEIYQEAYEAFMERIASLQ